ncbi:MAG: LysE family translocator, partial [Mycobacterium sp.]|nr:LysE family translocator [Mycobacterium sp.]
MKIASAAYQIYLGTRMVWTSITTRPGTNAEQTNDEKPRKDRPRRAFRQGLGTNLHNPKAAVFFTAVVPEFIPTHGLASLPQAFGLALIAVTCELRRAQHLRARRSPS